MWPDKNETGKESKKSDKGRGSSLEHGLRFQPFCANSALQHKFLERKFDNTKRHNLMGIFCMFF